MRINNNNSFYCDKEVVIDVCFTIGLMLLIPPQTNIMRLNDNDSFRGDYCAIIHIDYIVGLTSTITGMKSLNNNNPFELGFYMVIDIAISHYNRPTNNKFKYSHFDSNCKLYYLLIFNNTIY